ncbi:glycerate kinase type-2 family protein [Leisingera thetidis]|uniref:glycerate kinase type-2 family protein n=1 Tax=Leisingera thetidis TaxID=2930199 RepID=UPI0021F71ADF|nr:DUF4147 domain-containing protein [Leisingera thetidis]
MFNAAVRRADPAEALRSHLQPQAAENGRCFVVAVGKAAIPMMREALQLLPRVDAALAVTNPENLCALEGTTVIAGSHPLPDASSAAAGKAVADLLRQVEAEDRVVALISGGGSSLMVQPEEGIALEDLTRVNAALLASGLSIGGMNLVRQQIDALKGGGLLRLAFPATVEAYVLSDVIGDDLRAIASGPTVSPIGTRADAARLLKGANLWPDLPENVRASLSEPADLAPLPPAENRIIGSNRSSLEAMRDAAPKHYPARIVNDGLIGNVAEAAETILQSAKEAEGPAALIFGGETTVQLRGGGRGGRNQELALRVARGAEGLLDPGWVFLSGGTDGRDGPTEAAGGIVDAGTLPRLMKAGGNPEQMLQNNDSHTALKLADDLLMTGGTGTNVADVQVFLRPAS